MNHRETVWQQIVARKAEWIGGPVPGRLCISGSYGGSSTFWIEQREASNATVTG